MTMTKLHVSLFPTPCLDSGIVSPLWLHSVNGVCVFRCNLPPALLAECHCNNTGVEQTPNKSQHTKLTLEKKITPPLLPRFKLTTFRSWVRRTNLCYFQRHNTWIMSSVPGSNRRWSKSSTSPPSCSNNNRRLWPPLAKSVQSELSSRRTASSPCMTQFVDTSVSPLDTTILSCLIQVGTVSVSNESKSEMHRRVVVCLSSFAVPWSWLLGSSAPICK